MDQTSERTQPGVGRIAWALGGASALAVLLTIGGPGITIDEPLDVRPGRTYVSTLRLRGLRFFERATVDAVFRDNAEHPPLGRWLLGIASTLGEPFETAIGGSRDPVDLYIRSGRMAPALAFGLLVGLVTLEAGRRYGRAAGVASGVSLAIMPRVFAHAHLGALDTFIACFWTLGLLSAARAIEAQRPYLRMAVAGLAWGLALLTKIHAWFLPPIVLAWCLSRVNPARAVLACSIWAATGLALFFAGWPWLWFDTVERLLAYLGTGVERVSIRVLYFGQVFADRDVPWHYPWFYLAATVPVGLLALAGWGLYRGWRGRRDDRFPILLVGSIAIFPIVFSTRAPVYDGERLFLMAFPLLAILIGLGFASLWNPAGRRGRVALVVLLAGQAYGVIAFHPFGLSYYNLLVGGLPGAERLGLELTYWGDAVDGRLLDRLAIEAREGQTASMAPTLAPDQGKVATTRRLARIPVVIQDQGASSRADWLVVFRRSAYFTPEVRDRLEHDDLVMSRSRQGVWLSALLVRRKSKSP